MTIDPDDARPREAMRQTPADRPAQAEIADKALGMKQQGPEATRPENTVVADQGLNPTPLEDYPPSGAFDAEGLRPVLERSRKVR